MGNKDCGNGHLPFEKGGSDFLWYLKRCKDFLNLGKMGAIRILEMDNLHLKKWGSDFMGFEKAHRLSRLWKNGGDKDVGNEHSTFKKGRSDFSWYLKRVIDFLDFGKMGATRILEMDILHLKNGGSNI